MESPSRSFSSIVCATKQAVPLLVALHTWSGDYKQRASIPYAQWCIEKGWAFVHPQFRGPNRRPEATGYYQQALFLGGISKVAMGLVADRIPYRQALLVDYGLLAGSSFLLVLQPDMPWLPLFVFGYGVSTAARDVVYPLVLGHCFGIRYLGEIYGVMMIALFPGGALGPIFAATDWPYSAPAIGSITIVSR